MQLNTFLQQMGPFSEHELEQSLKIFRPLTLKKGEHLVKEGDLCSTVAFISSGLLRTYYVDANGSEITYCFCGEGKFTTAFQSFISRTVSRQTIEALEDSRLFVITYDQLQALYANFPTWQEIGRRLLEREYLVMEEYASELGTKSATERYSGLLARQPAVFQKVPLQHIASYLGVSRETLSRIRKEAMK
jgi:CRP-like cAMP-binding protein